MGQKTCRRKKTTRRSRRSRNRTARRYKRQRGGDSCPIDPNANFDADVMIKNCCKRPWYKFWGPKYNTSNKACLKAYATISTQQNNPLRSDLDNFFKDPKNASASQTLNKFKGSVRNGVYPFP